MWWYFSFLFVYLETRHGKNKWGGSVGGHRVCVVYPFATAVGALFDVCKVHISPDQMEMKKKGYTQTVNKRKLFSNRLIDVASICKLVGMNEPSSWKINLLLLVAVLLQGKTKNKKLAGLYCHSRPTPD